MNEGHATGGGAETETRRHWIAVLARAKAPELEALLNRHGGEPAHVVLKAPETGTVMIEGRAGGTGRRFNAGEATVTRCVVRLATGTLGVAYALGSDRRKALLSALIDGKLQAPEGAALMAEIEALAQSQQAARQEASRKAGATKVEFFTLVRGEG